MQFRYYHEVKLYDYTLSEPEFDSANNIFTSKLLDNKNKELRIKSGNMRLVSRQDKQIRVEFLHTADEYYQYIKNLDSLLKGEAEKHLSNILGNINKDTLDNMFRSSILLPEKLPSLPVMVFQLNDNCKFTGLKRRKATLEDFKENSNIEVHFVVHGINYFKNKCEIIYDVLQLKLVEASCETIESLINKNSEIEYQLSDNNEEN